ncbi:MAG: hypothetical protein ACKVOE_03085 [Rickettsiales bacterium]
MIQRISGQLRFYPNGDIAGFDIPTALYVADAFGYSRHALMLLFLDAEVGLKEAIQNHGDIDSTPFDPDRSC